MRSKFLLKMSKPMCELLDVYLVSCDIPVIVSAINSSVEFSVRSKTDSGPFCEILKLPGYSFLGTSA